MINKKIALLIGALIVGLMVVISVFSYLTATGGVEISTTISGGVPFNALVTFNGKQLMTPFKEIGLKPGRYVLVINREDTQNREQEIIVRRYQNTKKSIELVPIQGQEIIDETETQ